mmetsp:Transcript_10524/g.25746  ORF Transcript_10524/g.25746 Transcript_10524/m.25746 type:complete len:355 (-) Transcript_10524:624-1688(-)
MNGILRVVAPSLLHASDARSPRCLLAIHSAMVVEDSVIGHIHRTRPSVPDHQPVVLRARQQLAVHPSAEGYQICFTTHGDASVMLRQSHDLRRSRRHRERPLSNRPIQVRDSTALSEDLQHVQVAVPVKLVAGVVAGQTRGDPGFVQFFQHRHAPLLGRAKPPRVSVLQPLVDYGERHHRHPRGATCREYALELIWRLRRERAAVTAHELPLVVAADGSFCDVKQPLGALVAVLIHVEVQVQLPLVGQPKDDVQQRGHLLPARGPYVIRRPAPVRARHRSAQDTPVRLDLVRQLRRRDFVSEESQDGQRHSLQLHSSLPRFSQLVKHGPCDGTLHRAAHDVGSDRRGAVRVRGL